MTHICVSKLTTIDSDNGLSPGRRQTIIWTNSRILLIGPLGTTSIQFQSKFIHFHSRKSIWICHLENGGHFVSCSMCWYKFWSDVMRVSSIAHSEILLTMSISWDLGGVYGNGFAQQHDIKPNNVREEIYLVKDLWWYNTMYLILDSLNKGRTE